MIGSISHPVAVDGVIERPPGLLSSLIYGYRKGYTVADTIIPGRGYWVKAGSAGSIVLSSVGFPGTSAGSRPRPDTGDEFNHDDGRRRVFAEAVLFLRPGPGSAVYDRNFPRGRPAGPRISDSLRAGLPNFSTVMTRIPGEERSSSIDSAHPSGWPGRSVSPAADIFSLTETDFLPILPVRERSSWRPLRRE